jgi:UDP-3-O-[3-hydroxymyristoyl] glucosamine N-acyltransferase
MNKDRYDYAMKKRERCPEIPFIDPTAIIDWDHVTIGKNVSIGPGCIIGYPGFGYVRDANDIPLHIPHTGGIVIMDDVAIFAGTHIARGTDFDTYIGYHTKIDALCHIAHNVWIGNSCLIAAGVHIAGSVIIRDNVFVGVGSTIKDHAIIEEGTYIGSGSNVVDDVDVPYSIWFGNPARFWKKTEGIYEG